VATMAKCIDVPAPSDGADFSTCTQVVWETTSSLSELTPAEVSVLGTAVLTLFALAFVWKALRKVM